MSLMSDKAIIQKGSASRALACTKIFVDGIADVFYTINVDRRVFGQELVERSRGKPYLVEHNCNIFVTRSELGHWTCRMDYLVNP